QPSLAGAGLGAVAVSKDGETVAFFEQLTSASAVTVTRAHFILILLATADPQATSGEHQYGSERSSLPRVRRRWLPPRSSSLPQRPAGSPSDRRSRVRRQSSEDGAWRLAERSPAARRCRGRRAPRLVRRVVDRRGRQSIARRRRCPESTRHPR